METGRSRRIGTLEENRYMEATGLKLMEEFLRNPRAAPEPARCGNWPVNARSTLILRRSSLSADLAQLQASIHRATPIAATPAGEGARCR